MKKFLSYIMVLFVFMLIGVLNVKAVKITISGNDKVALNKTIDITFTVSDYSGVPGTMDISYNNSLLRCNSNCPSSKEINGNTTFTYSFVGISNGLAEINVTSNYNGADASKRITVGTVATTTKPSETAPTPSTTTTQAPKSNNANLKTLSVVAGDDSEVTLSPKFNASVYEYEATVASTIRTIAVNATMEDNKANMIISNNVNEELTPGENNKITVMVTAEDGTKKSYVINVKREALTADATLQSLSIKECKSFKLEPDKFTYTVKVKKNVKELTLDYVLSDENSTIEIEGNEDLKDGSKVKITVTAEDGTKKVYTLTISKEQETTKKDISNISVEKNPLIIMGLSIIAFGLIGGIIYVIKK